MAKRNRQARRIRRILQTAENKRTFSENKRTFAFYATLEHLETIAAARGYPDLSTTAQRRLKKVISWQLLHLKKSSNE